MMESWQASRKRFFFLNSTAAEKISSAIFYLKFGGSQVNYPAKNVRKTVQSDDVHAILYS